MTEVDTALGYTGGSSEKFLGELGWKERGLSVSTKVYPIGSTKHTPEVRFPNVYAVEGLM